MYDNSGIAAVTVPLSVMTGLSVLLLYILSKRAYGCTLSDPHCNMPKTSSKVVHPALVFPKEMPKYIRLPDESS